MFCDLVAGENLRVKAKLGTFKTNEFSEKLLIIEDLFAFDAYRGQYFSGISKFCKGKTK